MTAHHSTRGHVTVTVAFAALGAYLGRDLSGGIGLLLLIGTIRSSSDSRAVGGAAVALGHDLSHLSVHVPLAAVAGAAAKPQPS